MRRGETFALRVKGTSRRDDGIFPGDVVVAQKQNTAQTGDTVIALFNGEGSIKTCHRKAGGDRVASRERHDEPIAVKKAASFDIEGLRPA
jgi:repressor LexA